MTKMRLHLDEDASSKPLHIALLAHGHDVTRTPNAWMLKAATDETQLLGATTQGRCIFTFNIRDFILLSEKHPKHNGIILAAQSSWSLSMLIEALDRAIAENDAENWVGRVCWLNEWR